MNHELKNQEDPQNSQQTDALAIDQMIEFRGLNNGTPPSRNSQSSRFYSKALTH